MEKRPISFEKLKEVCNPQQEGGIEWCDHPDFEKMEWSCSVDICPYWDEL